MRTPMADFAAEVERLKSQGIGQGGRLEKAIELVLAGHVRIQAADGSRLVTGNGQDYLILAGQGCPCSDAEFTTKWCKHFIAAHLHDFTQDPQAAALPEAASLPGRDTVGGYSESTCCVKQRLGKRELSWTLRGDTAHVEAQVLRLGEFLDALDRTWDHEPQIPPPATNGHKAQAPMPGVPQPVCPDHGTQKMSPSKFGTNVWKCDVKVDGVWCNKQWQGPKPPAQDPF